MPQLAGAADFYKGKTLNIVIGFSPGGGYDTYSRALSRHIAKHIPGRPNVIVQNMPGAGSLTAVRALAVTQPKDGTYMNMFNNGLLTQSVVMPDRVKLEFTKFNWIGSITPDFRVCYGYGPNGPKTWEQLLHRQQFNFGTTGKSSGSYINGAILKVVFDAPVKIILGFPGSSEVRLAVERGELDGDCGSFSSIPPDWIRDKKAHVFVRFTKERPAEIPNSAGFINDYAKTQQQKDVLNVLDAGNEIGRPFIMAREVPADRVAIMRKAFDETMRDPAFLADAKKLELPVHPMTGEEAAKIIAGMAHVSPAVITQAKKVYD
jgi:tripartite-type tricarboxylate transporter receptor subunit TctC